MPSARDGALTGDVALRLAPLAMRRLVALIIAVGLGALTVQASWAAVSGLHSHIGPRVASDVAGAHHDDQAAGHSPCLTPSAFKSPGAARSDHVDHRGVVPGSASCDSIGHHWLFGAAPAGGSAVDDGAAAFTLSDERRPETQQQRPPGKPPKI